jgi:sec-independent protein translocase protein TatB
MLKANRLQWISSLDRRGQAKIHGVVAALLHLDAMIHGQTRKIQSVKLHIPCGFQCNKTVNPAFRDSLQRRQGLCCSGFVSAVRGQVSLPLMGTPPIQLGSIGMADTLILMVLALVVFGPRRLPQIGRQIGKLMYEFRKASNDFKYQMEEELRVAEEADRRKKEEEQRKQLAQESVSATPAVAASIHAPAATTPEALRTEPGEPRIMPPSTGEPVASSRRSELAELTEPPKDDRPVTPQNDSAPATEAASSNG